MSSQPTTSAEKPAERVFNSLQQISKSGEFKRTATDFHQTITPGGVYEPEAGRYVLYVSLACPWACRCLIVLQMLGLGDVIDVVVVHPVWGVVDAATGRKSWVFGHVKNTQPEGPLKDIFDVELLKEDPTFQQHLHNVDLTSQQVGGVDVFDKYHPEFQSLRQLYELNDPEYQGRFTVPVLFDTKTQTIVNNESSEIIQIFDKGFGPFRTKHTEKNECGEYPSILHSAQPPQLKPQNPAPTTATATTPADVTPTPAHVSAERAALEVRVEEENVKMYNAFNNGVYRAGFATTQAAYWTGVRDVYQYLDYLDELLAKQRFIAGDVFTEADIRCLMTLFRFDDVYVTHFKCAQKTIQQHYTNIFAYMCDVWQNVFDADCRKMVNTTHIKYHYYCSHETLNKYAIVPDTPQVDYNQPFVRKYAQ